jgi:6-phosphogluconate dehydrogenase (decarboxylating)
MVHNGIEYAMMQGYGEAEILASSKTFPNPISAKSPSCGNTAACARGQWARDTCIRGRPEAVEAQGLRPTRAKDVWTV